MKEAILGIGSNLFDKNLNLETAISSIKKLPNTRLLKVSRFYENKPFKVPNPQDQEDFLNCCVKISTDLSPFVLLGCCLGIEAAMGRERPYRFSSRIIDIDIILYEDFENVSDELTLPHPRACERDFVLLLLKDLGASL